MANLRNAISVTDRMAPILRSILKAMDSTLKVMRDLDRASNSGVQSKAYQRAEKEIQRANNALIKMSNYNQMVARTARDGERAYSRMGSSVNQVSAGLVTATRSSTNFLHSLAAGVYLAEKMANVLGGIMTTSDASRSQVARMGLFNTSNYTNEELYGQVFRTALNTRSDLTDTSDLANKILISGVYSGQDAAQAAIGTAEIINKALIAGGGTAEENQRALRQLTQGLASGVLQGDELRSIREQTPYFAKLLAEGLSKLDDKFKDIGIGDLKKLGAEGELTADRIVKAMWAMQDEIDSDFKAMPKTFGQAVTSMKDIWQYFLWLLSDTDGPLGKINQKLWQFVDYLQSPKGVELLNSIAVGINVIATALTTAMQAVGDFIVFLQDNAAVAQAIFIALGTAAVTAAIYAAAAWLAVAWPILLVIGVVGLLSYAFLSAGYTAQDIIGAVVGSVLAAGALIWDAVLKIVEFIMTCVGILAEIGLGLVTLVINGVLLIVQIIMWAVTSVISVIGFLATTVDTVFSLAGLAVQGFVVGAISLFYGLAQIILGVLGTIANGIDAVFGSNLSQAVSGWSGTLEGKFTSFIQTTDPKKSLDDIKKAWSDYGSKVEGMFTSDANMYDEMNSVIYGAHNIGGKIWDMIESGETALKGYMVDPMAAYDAGNNWGAGLVDQIESLGINLPDSSILRKFDANSITVDGGYLDGIKSDVDIKEEDLKLLRDMAARDYLLQLQSITPVANVTFGDVRETADVNKIVDVIEQMVEEQMATSLVS